MKKFFLNLALSALRDFIEENLTVDVIDGKIDSTLEFVRSKLAMLLGQWPEIATAVDVLIKQAQNGQDIAQLIVNALDEILSNSLTVSDAYTVSYDTPSLDDEVCAALHTLRDVASYGCDDCV